MKNNILRGGLLVALLIVLFGAAAPGTLLAQTGGEGGIQGTVTDTTGAAVPNASVVVTNQATGVAIYARDDGRRFVYGVADSAGYLYRGD